MATEPMENHNVSAPMGTAEDNTQLQLRRGVPADLHTLVQYNIAMAKETEGLDLPLDTVTAGVAAVLEGKASASYFVIEQQGQGVVAQLMITTEWSDWRAAWVWWIQSVYVAPAWRKRGYFRKLYEYVKSVAVSEGVAGLRLYADTANTPAHATYERLGMRSHYKVFEDLFTSY